jgi:hypothetical protein
LCSAGLTGKGLIKTAVWHEPAGTFVHAPIFVTINTNKILGLQQGEVVQKMDFVFEQICSVEKKETLRYYTTKNNSRENGKKLTLSE